MQEETRHHKQQLLLKSSREKSQFSEIAEGVVSCAEMALHKSAHQTVLITSLVSCAVQKRSIVELREFITSKKKSYVAAGEAVHEGQPPLATAAAPTAAACEHSSKAQQHVA